MMMRRLFFSWFPVLFLKTVQSDHSPVRTSACYPLKEKQSGACVTVNSLTEDENFVNP